MVLKHSAGIRRLGSAGLDLAYVAAGKLDGFWKKILIFGMFLQVYYW